MKNSKSILLKQIQQITGIEGVELIAVEPEYSDQMLCHIYFDPASVVDRLTPDEVALKNYNATVKSGMINYDTTIKNFVNKIDEETIELLDSSFYSDPFDPSELADIVITCENMALHYGIDLQAEKEKKMIANENRK